MKTSFRNITILIILIITLPVLFFSAYEIVRINRNEKELESIYNKQLDAILFSINLYSDDIINSWAGRIRNNLQTVNKNSENPFEKFFAETPQLKMIAYSEDSLGTEFNILHPDSFIDKEEVESTVKKIFADSIKTINRLEQYYKSGYQKVEALNFNKERSTLFVVFVFNSNNKTRTCFLEIEPASFIKNLLAPKIQSTAENKLDIGINDKKSGRLIYSFGNLKKPSEFQHRKDIWLFPQYEMGIRLKDKSLVALSKEQSQTNLIFILLADLVFALAAFMVYRNIRKELKLTQIKSEFISNVSHEIRTPLALISMYAETLEMDRVKTEEKKKEYYQVIYNEAQRLTGIVSRILNFSKMESGKRTYQLVPTDLNELVTKVMQSYSFHLKNKGFEYAIELKENLPLTLTDPESITDVIINLLDNAIKYSAENKYIKTTTGEKDGYVFVSVSDKGIGIDKEDQKLVFEKFYRVSKGNLAHVARGTGLGLTIVKNILDANNGKITLESKKGEGSTFIISFPINK